MSRDAVSRSELLISFSFPMQEIGGDDNRRKRLANVGVSLIHVASDVEDILETQLVDSAVG